MRPSPAIRAPAPDGPAPLSFGYDDLMKRILIIEDETSLADALAYSLRKEGFEVETAQDGAEGLGLLYRGSFDVLLLDLMLPGMDGMEICRRVRAASTVPIIIITAKDNDIDEILGLEMGADDYVTKPFNTRTLIARIRSVLRRIGEKPAREHLSCGEITMDREKHEVSVRGVPVELTPTEYRLLELLMSRPGKVIARQQLLDGAWGDFYGSGKTLDVHIRHLRKKIEADPENPACILTVRGTGYKLAKPDAEKGNA